MSDMVLMRIAVALERIASAMDDNKAKATPVASESRWRNEIGNTAYDLLFPWAKFSKRIRNCADYVERGGGWTGGPRPLKTYGNLFEVGRDAFLRIRNMGVGSMHLIDEHMRHRGLLEEWMRS